MSETSTVDPGTMEVVQTDLVPFEQDDGSDPDRRAHIVRPADNGVYSADDPRTAKDIIAMARLTQTEVVALCGHVFVPKHNPESYDACERCIEMAGLIDRGEMH